MKRDYAITFLCEFIVMASLLYAYRLVAHICGNDGFAIYSLTRRLISMLQLPLVLGMGISIPRYMSISYGSKVSSAAREAEGYFFSGFIFILFITIVFLIVTLLFQNAISYLLFGDSGYAYMIIPMALVVVGATYSMLIYGYFRGKLNMLAANALQFTQLGVVPIVSILAGGSSVRNIFMITGISMISISAAVFIYIMMQSAKRGFVLAKAKELAAYGIIRVPGEVALMGLLALPPIVMAHISGAKEAGYLAFGISIISMLGSLYSPAGLIMLPAISRHALNREKRGWEKSFVIFAVLSIVSVIIAVAVIYLFGNFIIRTYLGAGYGEAFTYVKICLPAAVPYVFYIISRNVLDALYVKPLNTINLIIALALFIILTFGVRLKNIPVNYVIATTLLGLLMVKDVVKSLKPASSET